MAFHTLKASEPMDQVPRAGELEECVSYDEPFEESSFEESTFESAKAKPKLSTELLKLLLEKTKKESPKESQPPRFVLIAGLIAFLLVLACVMCYSV